MRLHDFTGRLPGWVCSHLIRWAEHHRAIDTEQDQRQYFIYHLLVGHMLYADRSVLS